MAISYLHERLTRSLLEEMASGTYREGLHFLSLRTIRRLWKVSEPTVLSSLRSLGDMGLIQSAPRQGYVLRPGFQQKAQVLLRRNRTPPLKPPLSLQQKMRLLQNIKGGKVVMLFEDVPSAFDPDHMRPGELQKTARALERQGKHYGFECHWLPYIGDDAGVEGVRARLTEGDFHGAVVYCRSSHKTIQWMLEPLLVRQLPVVVIYDDCSGLPVNSINLNNVGLGYDAIRQLYRMGHRRITVLARHSLLKVHANRVKGCLIAHSEGGCQDADLKVLKVTPNKPISAEVRRHFASASQRPTAVFACESRILSTLAPCWKELGISVPDDISVIMASSKSTLSGFEASLDSMQLKEGARIGRLAAKLLHRIQDGEPLEKSVLLDVKYVRRGSVNKLSPGDKRSGKKRVSAGDQLLKNRKKRKKPIATSAVEE